ncbi:hypothetical protein ACFE04_027716 [Oxalis oulophora]
MGLGFACRVSVLSSCCEYSKSNQEQQQVSCMSNCIASPPIALPLSHGQELQKLDKDCVCEGLKHAVEQSQKRVESYRRIDDKNQEELFRMLRQQAVAAFMKAEKHVVYIIGWDKDNWIICNSWSDEWAEGGDTKVRRTVELYEYDILNREDGWSKQAPDDSLVPKSTNLNSANHSVMGKSTVLDSPHHSNDSFMMTTVVIDASKSPDPRQQLGRPPDEVSTSLPHSKSFADDFSNNLGFKNLINDLMEVEKSAEISLRN